MDKKNRSNILFIHILLNISINKKKLQRNFIGKEKQKTK